MTKESVSAEVKAVVDEGPFRFVETVGTAYAHVLRWHDGTLLTIPPEHHEAFKRLACAITVGAPMKAISALDADEGEG